MSDPIEIYGMKELKAEFDKFPITIQKRVANRGLSKAAGKLRTYLRRAAPKQSGELKKSIGILKNKASKKQGFRKVGLVTRYYYKTLEFPFSRRGHHYTHGLHEFFEYTAEIHAKEIGQIIINETTKALYSEWGKVAARNQR